MKSPAPPRAKKAGIDFHTGLWIACAIVVVVMASVQFYDIVRRLEIVVETAQQNYASLARSLAEQTRGALQIADVVVQDSAADSARTPADIRMSSVWMSRFDALPVNSLP